MLAQLWMAEGIEAVLEVVSCSAVAREHEVIHELHAQAVECQRTAPQVAAQLDRVAGQLTEIHAALRAAEGIEALDELLRWQLQARWRLSAALQGLLAAVAASAEPATWPWRLERLLRLQAELDRLLTTARELTGLPAAERRRRLAAEPRLQSSALVEWLAARAGQSDADAPGFARLYAQVEAWRTGRSSGSEEPTTTALAELEALAELLDPWHRRDPALDRTCRALVAEVVSGQRALNDALRTVMAGTDEPELGVLRRACLLMHLLEAPTPAMRRAALVACTRLVASPEAQGLDPEPRATLVLRWAAALELCWRVLPDPPVAFEGALRLVDHVRSVVDTPALAHALVVMRTRLLRRLAGWRDGVLDEAIQAHQQVLRALAEHSTPGLRGRVLGELAGLRRARRGEDPDAQDHEVRALYDEALVELRDAAVVRARVLADYAVYLAQPLRPVDGDAELALALAHEAVARLEGLPAAAREHPLLRLEEASHRLTLGNVRLEVGESRLGERQAAAIADYHQALARLGQGDEVLAGLVHLNLACVALAIVSTRGRDEQLRHARELLEPAVRGLSPLPVPHARAVAERAMLAVRAAPDDEQLRERSIREIEAALHRLPLGVDRVVRARVQRQLGELHLHRDGPDDLVRAAEHFAAARSAFVEGGAVRLAVEAARDYAEAQLRQHADDGDPAALTRGAAVLEQSALLAEQRWASRGADEPLDELTAMLDGVYGDLAWLLAKLERPAEAVLHTVTRAKRYRAHPSLGALQTRAERSSMLSPAHLDPLARRSVPPLALRRAVATGPSAKQLQARALAFAAANPTALALDLTLTRWGTVAVAVSVEGLAYATVPLSRETVRRWVWGGPAAPGWWAHHLAYRDALDEGREAEAAAHERAWVAAGHELAAELGARLLEPLAVALARPLTERILLLAPGRLSGLPLGAARIAGEPLVAHVKGLAQLASLAELPAGPLPDPRPRRALCVVADPERADAAATTAVEELQDVVRLLASGQAEVEVLVRVGEAVGEAVYRPAQARTRERTVVSGVAPTIDAVLQRVPGLDHVFHGGCGRSEGLLLLDATGRVAALDAARLAEGPRWAPGSSVLLSAATRRPPPVDDAATWSLVRALHDRGVGCVILATCTVPHALARDLTRGLYLYWALGRSLLEAFTAALANLAGSDASRIGGFVVSLGATEGEPETAPPWARPQTKTAIEKK
jgi:CHAT domain